MFYYTKTNQLELTKNDTTIQFNFSSINSKLIHTS